MKSKNNKKNKVNPQIIYVWNYIEWGGAQIYMLALMKEIKKHCDVRVVLPESSNSQLLSFLDSLQIPCDFIKAQTDGQPAETLKRKIQRHYRKLHSEFVFYRHLKKYDLKNSVVHTEFAPWMSMIVLYLLTKKTKIFTTVHNAISTNQSWRKLVWKLKFKILTKSENFKIFTANEDAKRCLKEYVSDEFYNSIKVTYASINPSELDEAKEQKFNRDELCKRFGIPNDKFLVLCVGQFIDRKGRWIFLEAARKVLKNNNDTAFVWISNYKPSKEDLMKSQSFGIGSDFILITSDQVGNERKDLFNLIRLADLFTLPSYIEGLPISLLEASVLEKTVISTNINGIPEAIKHKETGWLINPGNSDELAEAIEFLKSDDTLRKRLAEKGRDFVIKNFDERVVAKIAYSEYLKAFNE